MRGRLRPDEPERPVAALDPARALHVDALELGEERVDVGLVLTLAADGGGTLAAHRGVASDGPWGCRASPPARHAVHRGTRGPARTGRTAAEAVPMGHGRRAPCRPDPKPISRSVIKTRVSERGDGPVSTEPWCRHAR